MDGRPKAEPAAPRGNSRGASREAAVGDSTPAAPAAPAPAARRDAASSADQGSPLNDSGSPDEMDNMSPGEARQNLSRGSTGKGDTGRRIKFADDVQPGEDEDEEGGDVDEADLYVIKSATIDRSQVVPKPFLGGYRHRVSGLEYHHASTQTIIAKKAPKAAPAVKFHRDTQTVEVKNESHNTMREMSTQMSKTGYDVDNREDKTLYSKPYRTADEVLDIRLRSCIIIQAYMRGARARMRARALRGVLDERKASVARAEEERAAKKEEQRLAELERRMNPRTAKDFELLHNELEAWRVSEVARIDAASYTKEERKDAMAELLTKLTELLQTLDRLKLSAGIDNQEERVRSTLELMSAPKQWALSDGKIAEVHTPFTIRAKELADLYNGLKLANLSVDERLDVLLHVKWTVKEFDCNLTRDIVDLIDREADLLSRGRPDMSLDGLRKRLLNLFLEFIRTPEFNPEAARFQKVPYTLVDRAATRINTPKGRMSRDGFADRGERPSSVLATQNKTLTATQKTA